MSAIFRSTRRKVGRGGTLWLIAALLLLCEAIVRLSLLSLPSQTIAAAATLSPASSRQLATSSATAQRSQVMTQASAQAASVTPSCTPDTSNVLPAGLDLTNAPAGLSRQIEQPHYYTVFGVTGDQVRRQIIACAPAQTGGEYTGFTAYNLSWRYDFSDNTGRCTVANLKVGLNVGQVLPSWQSAGTASPAFTASWRTFATALAVHEQGHVTLDEQYAARLLMDVQPLSATDCPTLATLFNATAQRDVAALDQANGAYDARTNHGATQGAILP